MAKAQTATQTPSTGTALDLLVLKTPPDDHGLQHGQTIVPPNVGKRHGASASNYISGAAKAVLSAFERQIDRLDRTADGAAVTFHTNQGNAYVTFLDSTSVHTPKWWGKFSFYGIFPFLAEAFLDNAEDFLAAYGDALGEFTNNFGAVTPETLSRVADELVLWMQYRDGALDTTPERLHTLRLDSNINRLPASTGELPVSVLYNLADFNSFRAGEPVAATPQAAPAPKPVKPYVPNFVGPQLDELKIQFSLGWSTLLIGPASVGKSTCVEDLFKVNGLELDKGDVVVVGGTSSLEPYDLLGGAKTDGTYFDGPLTRAMREGKTLWFNEMNRAPSKTVNTLLGALAAPYQITLTDRDNEIVTAAPGFRVIADMNWNGQVAQLDDALVSRFQGIITFDYMKETEESKWLARQTQGGLPKKVAEVMAKLAAWTREERDQRRLPGNIVPRTLLAWATRTMVSGAFSTENLVAAADSTFMLAVTGISGTRGLPDPLKRAAIVTKLTQLTNDAR